MVNVRFAPSPTGFLHIGGARTALFNWMYARSQGGKFILRIEDTDQQRSTKEFELEILDSMKWLGLDWDDIYYQSKRFDIYREHAEKLVSEGKAYQDGEAIILTMPKGKEIKIYDLIRGEITFNSDELKDQVLMKSDGSPAYSFCCVVDDALMEISCVCRGEDHISNTPKQIVIYEALGFKPPKFAHLPLIMGEDGSRLSKRNGAVAVSDYRKNGYLPQAIVNYLMLLGWSPGNNQEIVDLDKAVKNFSIKKINKAAAIFSMDKLNWINNQYLKKVPVQEVVELLIPFLRDKNLIEESFDQDKLFELTELFKGRLSTLQDFCNWADFAFVAEPIIEEEAREQHLAIDRTKEFNLLIEKFNALDDFTSANIEAEYKKAVESLGLKTGDLIHPVRVAITGKAIGPSLFHIIEVLGKETVVKRLKQAFV